MALIVEDGTGKADADSYISVSDAASYHTKRGNTAWADISAAQQEHYLRRATDYMLQYHRGQWKGSRYTTTQALDWPRAYVDVPDLMAFGNCPYYVAFDVVPTEVKTACADYALIAIEQELAPNIDPVVVREKIDVIEVEYAPNSPAFTIYRAVMMKLAPYLLIASSTARLVRT